METGFSFIMFFFLLSVLLSAGASRAESRHSRSGSRASYLAGAALSALLVGQRLIARGTWAPSDFFEGALFAIAVLGAVSAAFEARGWRVEPAFPAGLSLVLGGLGLLRSGTHAGEPIPSGLSGHTLLMFLALAAFSASLVASVLFLLQDRAIKHKSVEGLSSRMPSLELAGRLNLLFLAIGTASMFAGALAGALYLHRVPSVGAFLVHPTVLLSGMMILIYSTIIMLRVGPLERGRGTAYFTIISYTLLLITFVTAHASSGAALK